MIVGVKIQLIHDLNAFRLPAVVHTRDFWVSRLTVAYFSFFDSFFFVVVALAH